MQSDSYLNFIGWAFKGFPTYMVNREYTSGLSASAEYNLQNFLSIYDKVRSTPAKAKIDLFLEWTSDDRTSVHAETQTRFANTGTGTYKVAFIVVEDGVGPYNQANNYSKTEGFGQFTGGGSWVSTMYNDVARDIFSAFGLDDSAIVNPEADNYYQYSYEVSLANVSDISKARVIAVLLDNSTRKVINCIEVPLTECVGVGNVEVADEHVSVRSEMGAVVVNGAAVTEVYTVAGTRVATAYGEASINLPAGLYIVKADKVVKKVVVK
ncbi:MAG: Omp28-related outer membrane protein [Muribaculaceae bacterium]|nr:Omp28-related outer membrane protein [Muribaculaceae bacterium]